MTLTLAFDVYGTLIDTRGVEATLTHLVGADAAAVSRTWRDKQLEYAFRRGLMGCYQPFSECTRQALDYALAFYQHPLTLEQRQSLLDSYRHLPAFADAQPALRDLQAEGHRLWAFSNGQATAVDGLLSEAGLRDCFAGIVSVDDVQSFKPSPSVYAHFLSQTAATPDTTWLVSSNPFDVIGARSAGWQAAWIQRSPAQVFDPWELAPSRTLSGLMELAAALPS